jgi:hypothetical protein
MIKKITMTTRPTMVIRNERALLFLTGVFRAVGSIERGTKRVSSNQVHLAGFEGDENGRSSAARRRITGERPAAVQAQGHDGRRH